MPMLGRRRDGGSAIAADGMLTGQTADVTILRR